MSLLKPANAICDLFQNTAHKASHSLSSPIESSYTTNLRSQIVASWSFGLAFIWRVYLAPVMRRETQRARSVAPRALALWYVTSLRSGRHPVLENWSYHYCHSPSTGIIIDAREKNDMAPDTSPLLHARREAFCRGRAAEFMNGPQDVTLRWGRAL